ncbi:MAG: phosphoenolpyruvate synthase [Tannerella sp.]|jgi:CheY-like chemotaxis protein|nr:phosphoenolpyruvate synthase [Tannerella sp.]
MGRIEDLAKEAFSDTSFDDLMNRRIINVLLVATKYDAFTLEDDGRVEEQIFNEYMTLNLRHPPRFTQVTTLDEAFRKMKEINFELVIVMPNMVDSDIFGTARMIKQQHPKIPIVVLTPFSKEVSKRIEKEDTSAINYIFSWLGNADVLLAIIKLIEDDMNMPYDTAAGVQIILVVEDSIRFYSSLLPMLYKFVLEQSREFSKEALNAHQEMLRKRGRPKIKLVQNYDEAVEVFDRYCNNILGIISDFGLPREGRNDPRAGYRFVQYVRTPRTVAVESRKPKVLSIPVIMESSETDCAKLAAGLHVSFVNKNSENYQEDMRKKVMEQFGFGDFVIVDPATKQEIMRIKNLKDLQQKVFDIPDDALREHLTHDHFSRFFYSRAMFPPAKLLKDVDVDEYESMDEARRLIFETILRYRRLKNRGIVAVYRPGRFDKYSHFARIGEGSLGGKGRGLAFIDAMIKRNPSLDKANFPVRIPKTVVLCTDMFDLFMDMNGLYPVALSDAADDVILARFQQARLPDELNADLTAFFDVAERPLAVRSSSLLEDAHYQPFAGIYSTYMTPNLPDRDEMLRVTGSAIKGVYASVFFKDSKAYMKATSNLIDREKMAVVLQETVGRRFGSRYYPLLSGVARSLNFYPVGNEKAEDGIANIAFGLGKYIVDGGISLRFSPRRPHHILQLSSVEMALKETQTRFLALDLDNHFRSVAVDDAFNLLRLTLKDAAADGALTPVASTCDPYEHIIRNGYYPEGRKILSFANILEHDQLPLAATLDELLKIGQEEMGRPIEIEFVVDIPVEKGEETAFYFLQIRPIVSRNEVIDEDLAHIPRHETILYSSAALGHGVSSDIYDIVYIKSRGFDPSRNRAVAGEIERINVLFAEQDRNYILVGAGRWGSEDPWLGVPVKWPNISRARVIAECSFENYRIEPSQGTHFFQNLTSHGAGYFTVNPSLGKDRFDEAYLNSRPAVQETESIRWVHFERPLTVLIDGRRSLGVVRKPEEIQ